MIRLLPCHPQRLDGEILSTWMLRVASANVNSVRELCKWLGSDAVLALDLMGYDNPVVGSIAEAVGVAKKVVIESLPSSFTDCILKLLQWKGLETPLLRPVFQRKRLGPDHKELCEAGRLCLYGFLSRARWR